jgi:hypothetical protein
MKYDQIRNTMTNLEKRLTALALKGSNLVVEDGDYYDAMNIGDNILNLSQGKNEVVFDVLGRPNVMVNYPIDEWARLDFLSNSGTLFTPDGRALHPAFYVNGSPRAFQVGKYLSARLGGTNTPVSLYGMTPSYSITLDQILALCNAMGNNFALSTNAIWSYLTLLSMRLAFQPRGNSLYGKSHAAAEYAECATVSGNNVYLTKTGTGPEAWQLLGSMFEPADLVGNGFERYADLKYQDGKWRIVPDNNAAVSGVDLSASSSLFKEMDQTGALVAPGTEGTLCYDYVSAPPASGSAAFEIASSVINQQPDGNPYGGVTFASLGTRDGVTIPSLAKELLLAPCAQAPAGYNTMRNLGEMTPCAGGAPNGGSDAGLGYRLGHNSRSNTNMHIVFRVCRLI